MHTLLRTAFLCIAYLLKKREKIVSGIALVICNLISIKSAYSVLDAIKQEMECVAPMRYVTDLAQTNQSLYRNLKCVVLLRLQAVWTNNCSIKYKKVWK